MAHHLLSNREEEVVALLLQGKSNKLIASALGISRSTVEFHLKNIYTKYQVASRTELIMKLGQTIGREKGELRYSTVAEEGEVVENRDRLNSENWVTSFIEAVSKIGKESNVEGLWKSNAHKEDSSVSFFEAIRVCLMKYSEFRGRASRSEFWWFALFVTLVAGALGYFSQQLSNVFLIAVLLPFLAVGSRRLQDSDKSGWWQLFMLVPVAGIILLGILWAMPPPSPQAE